VTEDGGVAPNLGQGGGGLAAGGDGRRGDRTGWRRRRLFDLIHLCPASMWAETPIENEEEPRILLSRVLR